MLERTYIIPLRKEWLKAQRYKRAKKAVNAVKQFLARHMKSEDVRILPELNVEIWKDGIKNPPGKVKIITVKDDKGIVWGQLFGKKIELEKEEEKGKKKKKAKEEKAEKEEARPTEKKVEKEAVKEEKPAAEETAPKPEKKTRKKTEKKPAAIEKAPKKEVVKKEEGQIETVEKKPLAKVENK